MLVFGFVGCLDIGKLIDVRLHHIKEEGGMLLIEVPDKQNNCSHLFTITQKLSNYVNRYIHLRPDNCKSDHFFCNSNTTGRTRVLCTKAQIKNVPTEMAKWLKLSNPESYNGHALRLTNISLLAEIGLSILDPKF